MNALDAARLIDHDGDPCNIVDGFCHGQFDHGPSSVSTGVWVCQQVEQGRSRLDRVRPQPGQGLDAVLVQRTDRLRRRHHIPVLMPRRLRWLQRRGVADYEAIRLPIHRGAGRVSLAPTTAQADGSTDEHRFIVAVRDNLPMYVIPGGRFATDDDVLASGYEACAALDRYPSDSMQATRVFYPAATPSTVRPPTTARCSCSTPPTICAIGTRTCTRTSDAQDVSLSVTIGGVTRLRAGWPIFLGVSRPRIPASVIAASESCVGWASP